MKSERELFEEEFKKVNIGVSFWLNTWSDEDNNYGHTTASWAWYMWQASTKREGFVLVPKEPTSEMLDAAKSVDARLSVFKYSDVWDAMLSAVEVQE